MPTLSPHTELPEYYGKDKRSFVRDIFDGTAGDYDRVERMLALGTGPMYRRQALQRAGLKPGLRVLDVATGTGLVAREAIAILGDPSRLTALDASPGMLAEARRSLPIQGVLGLAEALPFADARFDFLSMGFALRHVSDVGETFREFRRVLRPGGRVCILEITRPSGRLRLGLLKLYMRYAVPALTRLTGGSAETRRLWEYYWDTIEACIPPATITAALSAAGFTDVGHRLELGMFSEYTATRPG